MLQTCEKKSSIYNIHILIKFISNLYSILTTFND